MSLPLEGLSSSTRLAADLAAREGVHGGFHCDSFGGVLSPRACASRAKEMLRSGGTRRHLCDGAACGHYDPAWEGQITAEIAARPRCSCGEPLEGSHVRCPDCEAYHNQATANRTAARRKRAAALAQIKPDPTPALPDPTEGDSMSKDRTAAPEPDAPSQPLHRWGDLPIPEGAKITSKGSVCVGKNSYKRPCPLCHERWCGVTAPSCRPCQKAQGDHLAKMRQAKAAKARVEPRPRTKAERKPTITALNAEDPATMRGEAPDLINQPPHYIAGDIQCIDVIRALGFDFEEGRALKYLFRHTRKGAPLQDLRKCRFYVDALIARYEAGTP